MVGKKIIKDVVLGLMVIGLLIMSVQNLKAATVVFKLKQSSIAYWNDQGNLKSIENNVIPNGSTIQLNISIANDNGNINSQVSILEKEGLSFQSYYDGVLKINGKNVNQAQYQELINEGGLGIRLTQQATTISLQMTLQTANINRISIDTKVFSAEVNAGVNPYYCEHSFYGEFVSQPNYLVNFYSLNNELLSSQSVDGKTNVELPLYELEGYDFQGFNTMKDGSGLFFNGGLVTSSMNLYAIAWIKQFEVTYYVDNKVYEKRIVNFGEDAENIMISNKKNNKFLGWKGSLKNIRSDINVYAQFEKDDPQKIYFMRGKYKNGEKGFVGTNEKKSGIAKETNEKEKVIKVQAKNTPQFKYMIPFIILTTITVVIAFKSKRKKHFIKSERK